MTIIAIDPGPAESAFVVRSGNQLLDFGKLASDAVRRLLVQHSESSIALWADDDDDVLCVEMIASYGMPVGAEVFETCVWIGRFVEAWGRPYQLVYRRDVKLHLCGQARAKDGNVRQAIIDRYGGKAATKKGGALHGVSGDVWQALGVAITYSETRDVSRATAVTP